MRLTAVLLGLVAVVAVVGTTLAQDADHDHDEDGLEEMGEEEDEVEEVVYESQDGPRGPDGQRLTPEQARMQQEFQQQMITYLLDTLSPSCNDELRSLLGKSPQEQQANPDPFTEECRAEIQSGVQAFGKMHADAAKVGGEAGGAPGGEAGAPGGVAAAGNSNLSIIATVLLIAGTPFLGLTWYAFNQHRKREAWLKAHPEEVEKMKKARAREEKKVRKGKVVATE